jgi:hypothetical protein
MFLQFKENFYKKILFFFWINYNFSFLKNRKELERRKQLEECNSLSNCSISSASNSSSGSQSISFLEEIKAMGDHKRLLRPVNSADNRNNNIINANNKPIVNKTNESNGKTNISSKLVTPIKNCDNSTDKHKQHGIWLNWSFYLVTKFLIWLSNKAHLKDRLYIKKEGDR